MGLVVLGPPYKEKGTSIMDHSIMQSLPLQAILFWISVTLAPHDTSQILVKGETTCAWTKVASGWERFIRPIGLARGRKLRGSIREAKRVQGQGRG